MSMSTCPICDGVGLVRVRSSAGLWVSRACECQEMQREERRMAAAHIPERYRDYTLDGYEPPSAAPTPPSRAYRTARKFVEAYPVDTAGKGLLFTGSIGVGKTHLAVGVLRRLVRSGASKASSATTASCSKTSRTATTPRSTPPSSNCSSRSSPRRSWCSTTSARKSPTSGSGTRSH